MFYIPARVAMYDLLINNMFFLVSIDSTFSVFIGRTFPDGSQRIKCKDLNQSVWFPYIFVIVRTYFSLLFFDCYIINPATKSELHFYRHKNFCQFSNKCLQIKLNQSKRELSGKVWASRKLTIQVPIKRIRHRLMAKFYDAIRRNKIAL